MTQLRLPKYLDYTVYPAALRDHGGSYEQTFVPYHRGLVIDCRDDQPDPMTEAMLKVAGVFAEMERRMISERVKSGIANAWENDVSVGRPRITKSRLPKDFWQFYDKYKAHETTAVQFAILIGVSESSIYRYMRIADSSTEK